MSVVLANLGPRLRSPLNGILIISEILQNDLYGQLTGRQQQALHNLDASARHLLHLIEDLLDLAHIESNQLALDVQPVSADTICRASLLSVRDLARSNRVRLKYTIDPVETQLSADPKRLRQMLDCLLHNAVNVTPPGEEVQLAVTVNMTAAPEQQVVWFAISDKGRGFAASAQPDLLGLYARRILDWEGPNEETLLALLLASRLANQHGGDLEIESAGVLDQGNRFTLCLPHLVHPLP